MKKLILLLMIFAAQPGFAEVCCNVPAKPNVVDGGCVSTYCLDCMYNAIDSGQADSSTAYYYCADMYQCGIPSDAYTCAHYDLSGDCYSDACTGVSEVHCTCDYSTPASTVARKGPNCPSGETPVACSNISTTTDLGAGTITCQDVLSPREAAVAACKDDPWANIYVVDSDCYDYGGGSVYAYCDMVIEGYQTRFEDFGLSDCSSDSFRGCQYLFGGNPDRCDEIQ